MTRNAGAAPIAIATTGSNTYSPKCLKIRKNTAVAIDATSIHPLQGVGDMNPWTATTAATTPQTRTPAAASLFPFYCTAHGTAAGGMMAGAVWVVE